MLNNLIFDRTKADADALEALEQKGENNMTPEEISLWRSSPKGAYNPVPDWNRVESAAQYLQDLYNQNGYWPWATTKADWTREDIPRPEDWERYLENIATLRSILPVLPGTPEAPGTMDGFDWAMANDIERILFNIEKPLTYISTYAYQRVAATFYAGGGVTLQKFSRGR